ncbi:MAG: RHS repeat domain-containing protein [Thermoguttaceae bacterium]
MEPRGASMKLEAETRKAVGSRLDCGQLKTVTDPLGSVTTYGYNDLGQLTEVTLRDPDGAGSLVRPITRYLCHFPKSFLNQWRKGVAKKSVGRRFRNGSI